MNKHAFITGATGFLGVNLVTLLLKEGWQITATHRKPISHPELVGKPINWKEVSLLDVDEIKAALPKKPFVFFHMAANTSQWKPHYEMQTQVNVEGTRNVLEACVNSNVQRFIYTSSITTYGFVDGVITENTVQKGLESGLNYSISKLKAEQLVKEHIAKRGLDAIILAPCHIVGPWDTNNWIQLFHHVIAETVPGIPPMTGNFSWVEEVSRAHLTAATKGRIGESYILGGPYVSVHEFINEMERQLNKKVSKRAIHPMLLSSIEPFYRLKGFLTKEEPTLTPDKVKLLIKSFQADDSKAQKEIDYKHLSIPEIVQKTIHWIENNEPAQQSSNSV